MRLTFAWELLLPLDREKELPIGVDQHARKDAVGPRMRRALKITRFTAAPLRSGCTTSARYSPAKLENSQLPKIEFLLPFRRNFEIESAALSDEQV